MLRHILVNNITHTRALTHSISRNHAVATDMRRLCLLNFSTISSNVNASTIAKEADKAVQSKKRTEAAIKTAAAAASVAKEPDFALVQHKKKSLTNNKSDQEGILTGEKGDMFAVIGIAGTQYKVTKDDIVFVNKVDYEVGSMVDLDEVLLVGSKEFTVIGRPIIKDAKVSVEIQEQTKDAKVLTLKKRRRKHSQRLRGTRRLLTVLKVKDIKLPKSILDLI